MDNEGDLLVKLLDFGIAKAQQLGGYGSLAEGTRTGTFLGTPHYASPEQVQGSKHIDHRADIWAIGVIVYQCLTGERPFVGTTLGAVAVAICSHPLPGTGQRADVSVGFDAWFARACCRDVAGRFASVREAIAALETLGTTRSPAEAMLDPAATLASPVEAARTWGTTGKLALTAEQPLAPAPKTRRWLWVAAAGAFGVGLAGWGLSALVGPDPNGPAAPWAGSPAAAAMPPAQSPPIAPSGSPSAAGSTDSPGPSSAPSRVRSALLPAAPRGVSAAAGAGAEPPEAPDSQGSDPSKTAKAETPLAADGGKAAPGRSAAVRKARQRRRQRQERARRKARSRRATPKKSATGSAAAPVDLGF